jgi:hypothetical protein
MNPYLVIFSTNAEEINKLKSQSAVCPISEYAVGKWTNGDKIRKRRSTEGISDGSG